MIMFFYYPPKAVSFLYPISVIYPRKQTDSPNMPCIFQNAQNQNLYIQLETQ